MAKAKTFEEKLERLEEISRMMEGSNVALADSVKLYDEAGVLIKELREELGKAAEKVKILTGVEEGKATLEDFGE